MLRYGSGFHIPFVPCSVAERNGHKYELNEDGQSYTVVGIGTCNDTDIVIESYQNLPVTGIADKAFYGNLDITSITVGDHVNSIGWQSFDRCYNLKSVYIHDIASWCQIQWTWDDRIAMKDPDPCRYCLDANLYVDNTLVVDLVIPQGVTHIGDFAFSHFKNLNSVSIPDTVETIGAYAFGESRSLKSNLKSIYIHDIANWCQIQRGENSFPTNADVYVDNAPVVDLVIPQGVTHIGDFAFSHFKNLNSVSIPNTVETIGSYAFEGCTKLTTLSLPNSVTSVGSYAFEGCSKLTEIKFSQNLSEIGTCAFANCTKLTSITIPQSLTSIGEEAFANCYNLTSATFFGIPVQIEGRRTMIFNGCHKLVEIIDEANETLSLGSKLFIGTNSIKEVHQGQSKIDRQNEFCFYTYNGVNYLVNYEGSDTEITLPESYNNEPYVINAYAFYRLSELTGITISEKVTGVERSSFQDCDQLTKIVVKQGNPVYHSEGNCIIETASNTLIIGCAGSTIPDGVTTIGQYAFYRCAGLTSIIIPDSVTLIDSYAFEYCTELEEVIIGKGVETIGYASFYFTSLKSIIIPQNVKSIKSDAFYECDKLESVTLLNPTIDLGSSFESVNNIKDVYFAGTEEEWDRIVCNSEGEYLITGLEGSTFHYNYRP